MGYRSYGRPSYNINTIWVLIGINFVIFLITSLSPRIFDALAMVPAHVLQQPWTIVTSLFVHANFWHIFGNMITLYFFGAFLYRLVGENRFLLVYLGGGIVGNLFFILLGPSYAAVVGASGAIFALAGALAVMVPNMRLFVYFVLPMRLWVAVLVFFVIWSFIPGVAWQAHLGGLLSGALAGYIFRRTGYRFNY